MHLEANRWRIQGTSHPRSAQAFQNIANHFSFNYSNELVLLLKATVESKGSAVKLLLVMMSYILVSCKACAV